MQGSFRVNCLDCLDRTNLVQSWIASEQLDRQLQHFHVLADDQTLQKDDTFNKEFMAMWANNGDALSRQYSGTDALKGDVTRTGKRTGLGLLNDGYNSLSRYFINHFRDGARQVAMEIMTGQLNAAVGRGFTSPLSQSTVKPGTPTPTSSPAPVQSSADAPTDGSQAQGPDDELGYLDLIALDPEKQLALDICSRVIVDEDERTAFVSGWFVAAINRYEVEQERVLLLSHKAFYRIKYSFNTQKVVRFQRYPLADIVKIEVGACSSMKRTTSGLVPASDFERVGLRLHVREPVSGLPAHHQAHRPASPRTDAGKLPAAFRIGQQTFLPLLPSNISSHAGRYVAENIAASFVSEHPGVGPGFTPLPVAHVKFLPKAKLSPGTKLFSEAFNTLKLGYLSHRDSPHPVEQPASTLAAASAPSTTSSVAAAVARVLPLPLSSLPSLLRPKGPTDGDRSSPRPPAGEETGANSNSPRTAASTSPRTVTNHPGLFDLPSWREKLLGVFGAGATHSDSDEGDDIDDPNEEEMTEDAPSSSSSPQVVQPPSSHATNPPPLKSANSIRS